MIYKFFGVVVGVILMTGATSASIMHEDRYGEFSDTFSAPTDLSGYSEILGESNGKEDFEYFLFESFIEGTSSLKFTLTNEGAGSNMLVRLSSTPFTMSEWDWTIDEFDARSMQARELYANESAPEDSYSFQIPDGFDGPLYGFARFYGTNSRSQFSINAIGAQAPLSASSASVPLPGTFFLVLAALGGLAGARRLHGSGR